MKEYRIYTCEKMYGLSLREQLHWRYEIENLIKEKTGKKVNFIHPPKYYNYENKNQKSETEIKTWEINQIHNSDIVIVYLPNIESSIGTNIELGVINGINMFTDKYIPVVGIGIPTCSLHPWIEDTCLRIEKDFESAADYIATYLLV